MKRLWNDFLSSLEEEDWGQAAAILFLMLSLTALFCTLFWTALALLVKYSETVALFLGVPLLAVFGWRYYRRTHPIIDTPQLARPEMSDYFAVLETLRPALAVVAPAMGLEPVYDHSDLAADEEERILPWGRVWCFKYKAQKKSLAPLTDLPTLEKALQAQVKTVLEQVNPSGFSEIRFKRGQSFVPVVQIDRIKDGDAFAYIFVVLASEEYFAQVKSWGNRSHAAGASADDGDF